MHPTIDSIDALEILDSRGNPTVRVDVTLTTASRSARLGAVRRVDRARTRRSSCATATRSATAARACSRPSPT